MAFKTFLTVQQLLCMIIPTLTISLQNGNLGCFVDLGYQSDRKTDIIIFNGNTIKAFQQKKVNAETKDFEQYGDDLITNGTIQSVAAFDFTKTGVADLFVVTEAESGNFELNIWENIENQKAFQKLTPQQRLTRTIELSEPEVLIIDANGDFQPDIFGKNKDTQDEGFWFGLHFNEEDRASTPEFIPLGVDVNDIQIKSVSSIDLNQDCRADLVYITKGNDSSTTRYVKIISGVNFETASNEHKEAVKLITLLDGAGDNYQDRMYFADLNKDGAMDIIIATRDNNKIHLFFQKDPWDFKHLCSGTKGLNQHSFDGRDVTINVDGEYNGYKLKENLPIIVQDINMDSKINLVAVLENDTGEQKVFVTVISDVKNGDTLENIPGISAKFDEYIAAGIATGRKIKDVAFFHSGRFPLGLHFLIQGTDDSIEWIDLEPILEGNTYGFLSVCPLNDVQPTFKRYGGTMPGATVKAFFRARNGKSILLSAGTFYQTNSGNHLLPFLVFGLGEPDSYIEKLVIGYSFNDYHHIFQQPGVPPNSQLVLFAHPRKSSNLWRLETFLAPYITAPLLAIIIAVIMSVLGGFWVYLEIQEKKSATDDKLKAGSTTTNNFFF